MLEDHSLQAVRDFIHGIRSSRVMSRDEKHQMNESVTRLNGSGLGTQDQSFPLTILRSINRFVLWVFLPVISRRPVLDDPSV